MTEGEDCTGCGRDDMTVSILVAGRGRFCRGCWARENAPAEPIAVKEARPRKRASP